MSKEERKNAKSIAQAFKNMDKSMGEGGTGGTFKAAATKAGAPDTPEGRKAFANKACSDPDASPKLKKKACFYKNIIAK